MSRKRIYIISGLMEEGGLVSITAYSSGRNVVIWTLSSHYSHWLYWSSLTLDPEGHQHIYDPLELPHSGLKWLLLGLCSQELDVGCQGEGTSLG